MSLIIAHRGASAGAPENTMAAFRRAWDEGADGIETDVHLTADGRVVCIHDGDTQKVAGQQLVVANATYDELRALDVGSWKDPQWSWERIPLLEEALEDLPAGKWFFIELKTGMALVEPLIKLVEQSSDADLLVLMNFDQAAIARCKERLPRVKCHWLTDYQEHGGAWLPTADEVAATVRRLRVDGIGTESKPGHVNEEFVQQLRAGGVNEFNVWTVDEVSVARSYIELGAWAITTNRPGALRAELGG